ncbi:chemotaxis protein MotB [Chitinivorax tropicus]|uniref:Chemotaxis protein MotB n=1 Tax=Chitinivorax tropicus TaxID=714531 RepID=A0A840MRW9_9PROT|nr:flagellar motor protein MotD [Chitinivorax tropicus]MBB5019829.1 chemotaxis protein MotB [Chitinivorax tropicus]
MARRKKHEEHENHERWLVSYADFITLLFAFFVVMYAISQINEGKYRVLSDSLIQAFRNQPASALQTQTGSITGSAGAVVQKGAILTGSPPKVQSAQRKAQELKMRNIATDVQKVLAPLIKEGRVRVTETPRGIAVEINASVLFASGQADLQPASVEALTEVGNLLGAADNLILVEGHTDPLPINSLQFPSNWELSGARAGSVVRLFIESGVAPKRMTVIGRADTRPVEDNGTEAGRARNRRVTINILAENREQITELPEFKLTPNEAAQ